MDDPNIVASMSLHSSSSGLDIIDIQTTIVYPDNNQKPKEEDTVTKKSQKPGSRNLLSVRF